MKHFLLLTMVTLVCSAVALIAPFWGVMLYYTYATLRPQFLWEWSLANSPHVRWSLTAGIIAKIALLVNLPTVLRTFRSNPVFVLLLAYAVLMLLSMLTAFDPRHASYWMIEYAKVFVMAIIATLVIQRFWQVRAMAIMIALCLGYIAYDVNSKYFFEGGRLDIFHVGYGGLDNNGAGALLMLGLPFAYFLATTPVGAWSKWRRLFGMVLGIVILHAVMMTYSRGAMLSAAVGLTWLVLHHRPRFQAALMGLMLAGVLSVLAGEEIRDRFVSTADYKSDPSAMSRFDSWSAATEIALEHPLLGKGIRNSNAYSQNFGADIAGRTIHNQYLQVAADSGIPAALIYLGMILIGLIGLWLARRRCIDAEHRFETGPEPKGPHARSDLVDRARDAGQLCLALQTALLMFAFSAIFLSVELVEVPWLLIVLSGILPAAVDRRLDGLVVDNEADDDDYYEEPPEKFGPPVRTPMPLPERTAA